MAKMNTVNDVIRMRRMPGLWCALFFMACHPSGTLARPGPTDAGSGEGRIAFLSKEHDAQPPV
ncbi:MAG TPA: hypothetical protein VG271_14460, partial [Beijerinckiaceae bacterium]|nr:hypothetical protein [Beijerinckiaceae bacterium]